MSHHQAIASTSKLVEIARELVEIHPIKSQEQAFPYTS